MKIFFPEQTRCPESEYAIRFLWLLLLRVEKYNSMFDIFDQKWFMTSKIKNSQYGEVRSKKFFQILKELTKTRPMIYFSSQTDNMSSRKIRITDLFNIQEGSKSPPGGNQVDGLPPALDFDFIEIPK